jgi:hypothetical protein
MTNLTDAQTALDEGQRLHAVAASTANFAASHVATLRTQIASGECPAVTSTELATAEQEATHAALVVTGAEAPLAGLAAAVRVAKDDAICDGISGTLPLLGRRLIDALERVEAALSEFTVAANVFDNFAADSLAKLNVSGLTSPRVNHPRYGHPTIDGHSLSQAHGDRLLASVVAPALEALHAPGFAIKEHKLLASAAIAPPTS